MGHVIALSGGVGGARLAHGLANTLDARDLTIVVNTGDDFEHLGLTICPDIDSVLYALACLGDHERGWGVAGETWAFMTSLKRLGGPEWFNLGDQDLAMHVQRTQRLAAGQTLSQTTDQLAKALGLTHRIAPMSDQPVRTFLDTDRGRLAFQDYFVRLRCAPVVRHIDYTGIESARPSPVFAEALSRPDLEAIVICPSNPYLSVGPILALPGIAQALRRRRVPCVAVSPIVGGRALKGPAAKLMGELGAVANTAAIAALYEAMIDGLVIDAGDRHEAVEVERHGAAVLVTPIIMASDADRKRLARETLDFARSLARSSAQAF